MASGRGLQACASEQRRQAGHGAWRPRGGRRLTRSGAWRGERRGAREKGQRAELGWAEARWAGAGGALLRAASLARWAGFGRRARNEAAAR